MAWIAFAVLCASVLVDLALYVPSHRSTSLLILAALVAVYALGGIAAGVAVSRITPDNLIRLRQRASRWRGIYLVVGLLVTFGFGLGIRVEWTYFHIALLLGIGFALGYELLYADAPLSRFWVGIAVFAVIAITLLRISALSVYPMIASIDEPWDLSWAMSYVQQGYLGEPIMPLGGGDVPGFMLPVALWIELFGSGFWQVRLFFFLLTLLLIALSARIAQNLYGAGWLTVLFMVCSAAVLDAGRIRHDVGLALAVAASILLYTEALKHEKNGLHFAAGLFMGWGLFAHYHAIGFGVALTISLYLPRYLERIRRGQWLPEKALCLYILGGLLGGMSVVLLQILPQWEGFLAKRQLRSPTSLTELLQVFAAYWGDLVSFSGLEFILVAAGLVAALWRHKRADVMLVLLAFTLHLALSLQDNYTWEQHYLVPITPIYAIAVAAMFKTLARQKIYLALIIGTFMLAPNLGYTLQIPVSHLRNGEPLQLPTPAAVTWIQANVDPQKRIVAENWYYLFLTDYKFVSSGAWGTRPPWKSEETEVEAWDEIAPDLVIVDQNLGSCCWRIFDDDYLQSRGYRQVAEFPGDKSPVLVYEKNQSAK